MGTKRPIAVMENWGGLSTDLKQGPNKSFAYSRHIDFRKNPTSLTILPKTVKESSATVLDLITEMVRLPSGKCIAIGDTGYVYERATNGTWTRNGTKLPDTACGAVYNLQADTVYVAGRDNIHTISNADGRFGGSLAVNANFIDDNIDQTYSAGGSNSYTTLSSISETTANKRIFIPTVEPTVSVDIVIKTKGTAPLTLTMHDQLNNNLGSVTIPNASLSVGSNKFTFTTPVRTTVKPNATQYHFHVTHGTGTASTLESLDASDFSNGSYTTNVNRLTRTNNGFHPMCEFAQFICIGNGRYLTAWELLEQQDPTNAQLQRHRLVFPSGSEVTSVAVWTEYLAIAVEKRSTDPANPFQEGSIYFWDGIALNYNFRIDVPEGAPMSLHSSGNVLKWLAGGGLYAWAGGNPQKIRQLPNTDNEYSGQDNYVINNPNMMAVRNGILQVGFPTLTNSEDIEHGVYSYGSRNVAYPPSFGYSYTMSTGSRNNASAGNLSIGMVKSFADRQFVSWKDGSNYGVDVISPNSDPFPEAVWESLIIDNGRPDKDKSITALNVTFLELPAGAVVTPKYRIDRGTWVEGDPSIANEVGTAGETFASLQINKRYKELQIGLNLVATDETPEITSSVIIIDSQSTERD